MHDRTMDAFSVVRSIMLPFLSCEADEAHMRMKIFPVMPMLKSSQMIIATHSPILLGIPGAAIYCFDQGKVHPCAYEETESYRVTELFINNRQALLNRLLKE